MKPTKQKPKFGIIAPTAYLDTYSVLSSFHLALAHIIDKDENYKRFYRSCSQVNDFIIMDNGCFEIGQSYNPAKLLELGSTIDADMLVLPDYIGNAKQSRKAAVEYGPQFKDADFETMYVVHSAPGEVNEWIDEYCWATQCDYIDAIGFSVLGIPTALNYMSRQFARVAMTQLLISKQLFNYNKYNHYLGLNSVNELPTLLNMGVLNSCDSSNPVQYGLNGLRYNINGDSFMPINKKLMREVNFEEKWTENTNIHNTIEHNVNIVLEMFKNPTKYL